MYTCLSKLSHGDTCRTTRGCSPIQQWVVEKSGEFREASARNGGGNPEPSPAKGMKVAGKVQRLGVSSPSNKPHQRPTSHWDDEIVHSLWKRRGRCNRLVAGSSPARGAMWSGRKFPLFVCQRRSPCPSCLSLVISLALN